MGKHILVMTGSPRKKGNSDILADEFIKGAMAADHMTEKFVSASKKIGGCHGCNRCWSKNNLPCVQDDDFNRKLAPVLEQSEVLVLCMPLYAYSFPAQIKAPLDRLFPYGKEAWMRQLKIRETALIMCGADDTEEPFHAAIESYRHLIGFFGWKNLGELIVPNVNKKGDVLKTDGIRRAFELGKNI